MNDHASPEGELTALLIKTMTLLCVRNTVLEDIHAGMTPVTRTGDYSDVTVIDADGRRIPWPQVSHFDDDVMRDLMRQVVDRILTFQVGSGDPGFLDRIGRWVDVANRWDDPNLDESFLPGTAANQGGAP